jgi:hypothetical protein
MAVGLPLKTTYANGDVYSASDVNDTNGTINITAAPYAAGKNKILNSDFSIWQRGTTFTSIATNTYSADRWVVNKDKTATITQQTFTPGTAPVSGYEGTYYFRQVISGGSYYALIQKIEDVRQLAGQTVTLSYWAKADASVTNTAGWAQNFGSGGSSQVSGYASNNTITTSWQRFTATFSIPSISGKTIGTSSFFGIQPILIQNATTHTIDIWGMQLEVGSTATAFQTATGNLASELTACQRYFQKSHDMAIAPGTANIYGMIWSTANAAAATTSYIGCGVYLKQTMRTQPTITLYDEAGTSGVISRFQQGSATTNGQNGVSNQVGEANFTVYSTGTASKTGITFHYTASAEF